MKEFEQNILENKVDETNDGFWNYVKQSLILKMVLLIAVISLLASAFLPIYSEFSFESPYQISTIFLLFSSISHILLAVFAVFAFSISKMKIPEILSSEAYSDFSSAKSFTKKGESQLKLFSKFWMTSWILWALLYSLYLIGASSFHLASIINFSQVFVNNLTTFVYFIIFYLLSFKIESLKELLHSWYFFICLVIMALLTTFDLFFSFEQSYPSYYISPILSSIVISLIIGRLDSKFIKAPIIIIAFLYMYAVIQPMVFSFREYPSLPYIIIGYALFSKCLLFMLLYWAFRSKRLLYYYIKREQIDAKINTEWNDIKDLLK